jgi:hypothetical protein
MTSVYPYGIRPVNRDLIVADCPECAQSLARSMRAPADAPPDKVKRAYELLDSELSGNLGRRRGIRQCRDSLHWMAVPRMPRA